MTKEYHIKWFNCLDSTNDEALRHIGEYDNMSVIAAREQTAGRGQRGNSWSAAAGENLTFSLVLKYGPGLTPSLPVSSAFCLSKASSLAVCDVLDAYGINAAIKWPNDIYVRNSKICGMLIENSLSGDQLSTSVIGIGLNVNQKEFPPSLVNPVSMSLATGVEYSVDEVLETFCKAFASRMESVFCDDGTLDREYTGRLYRFGRLCTYVDCATGTEFQGRITGVLEDGRLKISLPDGSDRLYYFKEVSFLI